MPAPLLQAAQGQPAPTTALMLGGVQFNELEVPDEIDQFGGFAKLVEHEFAGGTVTIQRFGRFPVKLIRWSGQFFVPMNQSGQQALYARIAQVDQLLTQGGPIGCSFGAWNFQVELYEFYQKPRNEFWVPYTIALRPYSDATNWNQNGGGMTGGGNGGGGTSTGGGGISPANANPNSPLFSDNGSPNLVQNNSQLGTVLAGNQFDPQTPAPGITVATPPISNFQQSLAAGLLSAAGANPNSPVLQGQLSMAQVAASTAASSTDPGTQAFGLQSGNLLGSISQQLSPTLVQNIQLNPIANPNLMALANQYYGDENQWTTIAGANVGADGNRILTPNPIGLLTLMIPGVSPAGTV